MELSEKSCLRKEIKAVLNNNIEHFTDWSNIICKKIEGTDPYKNCTNLLAYMALPDEVDLTSLINKAVSDGKKVYIPKIETGTSNMDFFEYTSGSYETGSYGIYEPLGVCPLFDIEKFSITSGGLSLHSPDTPNTSHTLVLVPGRAFTKDGCRLGRGKGFYDTYLSKLLNKKGDSANNKVTFMGICFNCQVLPELPVEPHDIKMDLIISEE